jgi:hypothetical protein
VRRRRPRNALGPPRARYAGRLEIEEDLRFVRWEARAQRLGWALMALLLGAGLSGALGAGPLARAEVRAAPSWSVRHERVMRVGRPTTLRVTLRSPPAHGGRVQLWLARPSSPERLLVQQIFPTPEAIVSGPDALQLTFAATSEPGERVFELRLVPRVAGFLPLRLGCEGCETIALRPFALP